MHKLSARIKNAVFMAVFAIGVFVFAGPALSNVSADDREIHLDGTANTRDIGGYHTDDLVTLREGQIIRSENLSRLTPEDFQRLEEIGLKTVIDLRTQHEHNKSPTVWQGENPPQFFHFPIGDARNDWFRAQKTMMKKNRFKTRQSHELMVEGYRMIVEEGQESYSKLMEVVLDQSNWPVLIHCNAGKDRAGVAVTLILESLGVDRDTIMEEFLLTNEMINAERKAELLSKQSKEAARGTRFAKGASPAAWFPIVGVEAEMLEAFYTSVDEKYGSMDAFLNVLGVDQEARGELGAALTIRQPQIVMGE